MPFESEANSQILRTLLEQSSNLRGNSYKTSEYHTNMFTKNSHVSTKSSPNLKKNVD